MRAFSLVEVLVTAAVFLVIVLTAFELFDYGVHSYRLVNSRANIQTSATRTMLSLQNDLRRSSYSTVSMVSRTVVVGGRSLHRDALCFAGVSDWSNPAVFNPTYYIPNYDRYVIYYATQESPTGRLVRSFLNSNTPANSTTPPFDLGSQNLQDDPSLNQGQVGYGVLCDGVQEFTLSDLPNSRVGAGLSLFQSGAQGPAGGSKKQDQAYQMGVEVFPQNTWPRD